jgi:hypothetical protein
VRPDSHTKLSVPLVLPQNRHPDEGHGFSRATDRNVLFYQDTTLQADEGHGFSRATDARLMRALAPEVQAVFTVALRALA